MLVLLSVAAVLHLLLIVVAFRLEKAHWLRYASALILGASFIFLEFIEYAWRCAWMILMLWNAWLLWVFAWISVPLITGIGTYRRAAELSTSMDVSSEGSVARHNREKRQVQNQAIASCMGVWALHVILSIGVFLNQDGPAQILVDDLVCLESYSFMFILLVFDAVWVFGILPILILVLRAKIRSNTDKFERRASRESIIDTTPVDDHRLVREGVVFIVTVATWASIGTLMWVFPVPNVSPLWFFFLVPCWTLLLLDIIPRLVRKTTKPIAEFMNLTTQQQKPLPPMPLSSLPCTVATLHMVTSNPFTNQLFGEHCRSQNRSELFLFHSDLSEFHRCLPDQRANKAQRMQEMYIDEEAPYYVPISDVTKKMVMDTIRGGKCKQFECWSVLVNEVEQKMVEEVLQGFLTKHDRVVTYSCIC